MRYLIVTIGFLSLTACGSVYNSPTPSKSDAEATQRVGAKLSATEVKLLRLWQVRHPDGGNMLLGPALQAQKQALIADYKARGDAAETICVLIRSRSPRVDRSQIEVLSDPLTANEKSPGALEPCDAMAHYQGILAKIRRIKVPAT